MTTRLPPPGFSSKRIHFSNIIFIFGFTLTYSLYLWNVRVEWHSWKYDFLLPLHFTFTIFELKLENTSARQNKIKASFVLLSSRLYVSLSLRR